MSFKTKKQGDFVCGLQATNIVSKGSNKLELNAHILNKAPHSTACIIAHSTILRIHKTDLLLHKIEINLPAIWELIENQRICQ